MMLTSMASFQTACAAGNYVRDEPPQSGYSYLDLRNPLFGKWYNEKLARVDIGEDGALRTRKGKHTFDIMKISKVQIDGMISQVRQTESGKEDIGGHLCSDGSSIEWDDGTEWQRAYSGVRPKGKRFEAYLTLEDKSQFYAGMHDTAKAAAMARDEKFRELYKEKRSVSYLKRIAFPTREEKRMIAKAAPEQIYVRCNAGMYMVSKNGRFHGGIERKINKKRNQASGKGSSARNLVNKLHERARNMYKEREL